jgi:hypothetical protein
MGDLSKKNINLIFENKLSAEVNFNKPFKSPPNGG